METGKRNRLWYLALIIFFSASEVNGEPLSKEAITYPDVWYRLYEWPLEIQRTTFADPDIWGDEPVLIVGKENSKDAQAVGFFSGKKRAITITRLPYPKNSKGKVNTSDLTRYTYKKTGRRMKLFDRFSENRWPHYVSEKFPEGTLELVQEYYLSGGEVGDMNHSREDDGLPAVIGNQGCEPLMVYMRFRNTKDEVVWTKTAVRYYGRHEKLVGNIDPRYCSDFFYWLSTGTGRAVMLGDQTLLLVGGIPATAAVPIRLSDGSTGKLPPNLRLLDMQAVIDAKLDLLRRYKAELDARGVDRVHIDKSPEQVSRDLAKYFFDTNKKGEAQ